MLQPQAYAVKHGLFTENNGLGVEAIKASGETSVWGFLAQILQSLFKHRKISRLGLPQP